MSSKREEERNEKIIRGLLKLPPNRRCINCNSLGPQYVCASFWTFICTTCSGIHREFTHRVKSVSMAKFTSQEVDALQKGGNQRARELYLKGWDPHRNRIPDNSNVEKVREFIKCVYVDKIYSKEKSSDRPPRDPQSIRSHEDEMRRASSYHSYSQSPPYDFQYEERQYGKHAPVLTRKPGSDRGLYEGKLASFLSPTHLSDGGFANEGSHPRVSDYSVSGGATPFISEVLSPVSQRDFGSPSSDTSRDTSGEGHTVIHNSDANTRSDGGRIPHPQRTLSTGSFVSVDSSSKTLKSVNSSGLPEVGSDPKHSSQSSLEKSVSLPSLPQSSSQTFDVLDLFSTSFSQNANNTPQMSQPPPLDLFAALSQQQSPASFNEKVSDVSAPNTGGWATFDVPHNPVPTGTEKSSLSMAPSSNGNIIENFNPFTANQSSHQNSTSREPFILTNPFGQGSQQNVDAAVSHTNLWNAFGNFTGEQLNPNYVQSNEQAAVHCTSEADKSLGSGSHKAESSDSKSRTADETRPPPSGISPDFSIKPNDFPMVSAPADLYSFATATHQPTNPFDMPFDSDMNSSNMVWDMSSLQGGLPTAQVPSVSDVGVNESSWFPENSIPCYTSVPSGAPFDSTTGSLGFMAGQAPYAQIPNIHGQGPVASVGGNPFA